MTSLTVTQRRDAIIEQALPHVIFDGWTWKTVEHAAALAGEKAGASRVIFPGGMVDVLDGFADWADRRMMAKLATHDPQKLRVRDRIRTGVIARLEVLQPYKEAERLAAVYWMVPTRSFRALKVVWRTADRIWDWAGDTATDYNRYTKRGLLSGVITSTMMAWFDDESADMKITRAFLDRRIENVMQLGSTIGKFKPPSKAKAT